MTMKYRIKQTSPLLFILTLLTVIFVGMSILVWLSSHQIFNNGQPLFCILCFASIIGLAYYLPRVTSIAEIEITIENEGVKRQWLRQFIFHNKPDNDFKWTEIDDYVFEPDRQFDKFKLKFKDGTKFKFYHNNDHDSKDDFKRFLNDFVQKVEELNSVGNKRNGIKLGKTIYETSWGLLIAVIAIIIVIGLPILLFVLPHKGTLKSGNYAVLGGSYVGAIYYIGQFYTHRKKRKVYEDSFL
jgi:hypothetical protein